MCPCKALSHHTHFITYCAPLEAQKASVMNETLNLQEFEMHDRDWFTVKEKQAQFGTYR